MKTVQLTEKFVDYENFGPKGQSFGDLDKGREIIFEVYPNGSSKPIRVIFFISFLQMVANASFPLDEAGLLNDAKKILGSLEDKHVKTKELLYLYNFSTNEFHLSG